MKSIKHNFKIKNLSLPKNLKLQERAKELRKAGVLSEVLFWKRVNKKKLFGLDIDRQKIIGNYIVDFFVKQLGLVIEIDGSSHNDKYEYDLKRIEYLESLDLKVVRINDLEIKKNLEGVLNYIKKYIIDNYVKE